MQTPQNIYNIYFPYSFSWEITKECATAPKKNPIKGETFDTKAHGTTVHDLTQKSTALTH